MRVGGKWEEGGWEGFGGVGGKWEEGTAEGGRDKGGIFGVKDFMIMQ